MQNPEDWARANKLGGKPKPGTGWHPSEEHLWATPRFEIHPLTLRPEAVEGIFFRLWPEHVKILQHMRSRGWPPSEIIRVCREFYARQAKQEEKDKQLIEQHQGAVHQNDLNDVSAVHGVSAQNEQNESEVMKALSSWGDEEYRKLLMSYRRRFQGGRSGNDVGLSTVERDPLKKSDIGGFQVVVRSESSVVKAAGDGEPALTPKERKIAEEQSFNRKEVGVGNSAYTARQLKPSVPIRIRGGDKTSLVQNR